MKCRRYFRDINKRKLFKNTELIQRVNKVLYFSLKTNILKIILLENYSYYFSQVQIKNFCVVSGRSRGVHRKFKISRILLRELSGKGYFFGLKKASW